jgi:hypothetical protein
MLFNWTELLNLLTTSEPTRSAYLLRHIGTQTIRSQEAFSTFAILYNAPQIVFYGTNANILDLI